MDSTRWWRIRWPTARARLAFEWRLGARHRQIVRFVALRTARVIATALVAGLLIAVIAARSMNSLLFGVTPADAATYGIVCLLLLVSAAIGAYWPIRRATAVDPIVALRQE